MKKQDSHPLGVPGSHTWNPGETYTVADGVPANVLDRWVAARFLHMVGKPRIALRLWGGEEIYVAESAPVASFTVRDRATLYRMLLASDVGFGDAYSAGLIEVTGNLVDFLAEAYRGAARARWTLPQHGLPRPTRTRGNTLARSRRNIHHHYDLGNEFYGLWLDEHMVYTCAYYEHPGMTLVQAQVAKMDHICRKLDLQPGQQVIEAGCGWGALALHMAEHYGVRVRAFNISHEQIAHAQGQALSRGLADRVEFIEDDFRNIAGDCDAFVSIGMLEHVGVERYEILGALVRGVLRTGGRGLIHSIGRSQPAPNNPWIEKRIFPGSYPPSLSEMTRIFEPYEFAILDVENLRLHYRNTCQAWLERFEAVRDQVAQMYDEPFARAWRLYLAGSVAAFEVGTLQLYQVLFAPPGSNEVPWTRRRWYGAD